MCSQERVDGRADHNFASTVIHEFTHIYQKNISSQDIKYGTNVLTDTKSKLYKYYNIMFKVDSGKWVINNDHIDSKKLATVCNTNDEDTYFVSWYQCMVSVTPNKLPSPAPQTEPEEEMAESVKDYYVDPNKLKQKDSDASPSLGRYEYIDANFSK